MRPCTHTCTALQILTGDPLARLLLLIHKNLGTARHPRHQAAALGPLRAMLTLLAGRVTAPATFRYATTILLRLLCVRCEGWRGWQGRSKRTRWQLRISQPAVRPPS